MCPDFPNGHRLSLELAEWGRLYARRNPCAITPVEFLDVSPANRKLVAAVTVVGSEEARLRAGLRPPPKLHVRVSSMQLSRRHRT